MVAILRQCGEATIDNGPTTMASSISSSEEDRWTNTRSTVSLDLLRSKRKLSCTISVSVGLVPAKLVLSELVQVAPSRSSVLRVVHASITLGLATMSGLFIVVTVPSFKDVKLGVMHLGVRVIVHGSIFGTKVFGAIYTVSKENAKMNLQTHNVGARLALNSQ